MYPAESTTPKMAISTAHSCFWKAPMKTVTSAMNPASAGRPTLAKPANTRPVAISGICRASPPSFPISRVCVRSYINPTTTKSIPVIRPWASIW